MGTSIPSLDDEERARRLVATRAFVDVRDDFGQTALHRAAMRGKSVVCRILMDGGANAQLKDAAGLDAAALARLSGHRSLAKEISDFQVLQGPPVLAAIPPLTPAEIARVLNSPAHAVMPLIASGRRDAVDAKGNTLLHICAQKGALLACEKLFEAGIAIDRPNQDGIRAAETAEAKGHFVLAELLRGKALSFNRPVPKPDFKGEVDCDFDFSLGETQVDDAESFHTAKGFAEAPLALDWVTGSVIIVGEDGAVDAELDFNDLTPVEITGEGLVAPVPTHGRAMAPSGDIPEPDLGDFRQVKTRGRKSRRQIRPNDLGPIYLAEADCRTWLQEILSTGWADRSRIMDLIDLCAGGKDDDLAANVARFLEDCGLEASDEAKSLDPFADLDLDEMTDGLLALCNQVPVLPGQSRFNLTGQEERSLLANIRQATTEVETSIAADEVSLGAIISLAQGVLAGALEPHEVTRAELRGGDPQTEARFREALRDLETLNDGIIAGASVGLWMQTQMAKAIHDLALLPAIFEGLTEAITAVDKARSRTVVGAVEAQRIAIHAFLAKHLPWVRLFASREAQDEEEVEDIFQIAWTGLRRALDRFDPDRGNRFMSYSLFWMSQTVSRTRQDEGTCIRMPVHRHEVYSAIDAAAASLEANGLFPSDPLVAQKTGLSIEKIVAARRSPRFAELFEEETAIDNQCDPAFEHLLAAERTEIIAKALSEFDERKVAIIRGRFGFDEDEDLTLEELGQRFGLTRERIRQVEDKVLTHLAHAARLGKIVRFL